MRAIVVTHGALGEELLRTAEAILGSPQTDCIALSNTSASHETLLVSLRRLLEKEAADEPVLLFVDLLAGSCGHACQRLCRDFEKLTLISGVNLPMLIEFLYQRRRVSPDELIQRVMAKGREGIRCL